MIVAGQDEQKFWINLHFHSHTMQIEHATTMSIARISFPYRTHKKLQCFQLLQISGQKVWGSAKSFMQNSHSGAMMLVISGRTDKNNVTKRS